MAEKEDTVSAYEPSFVEKLKRKLSEIPQALEEGVGAAIDRPGEAARAVAQGASLGLGPYLYSMSAARRGQGMGEALEAGQKYYGEAGEAQPVAEAVGGIVSPVAGAVGEAVAPALEKGIRAAGKGIGKVIGGAEAGVGALTRYLENLRLGQAAKAEAAAGRATGTGLGRQMLETKLPLATPEDVYHNVRWSDVPVPEGVEMRASRELGGLHSVEAVDKATGEKLGYADFVQLPENKGVLTPGNVKNLSLETANPRKGIGASMYGEAARGSGHPNIAPDLEHARRRVEGQGMWKDQVSRQNLIPTESALSAASGNLEKIQSLYDVNRRGFAELGHGTELPFAKPTSSALDALNRATDELPEFVQKEVGNLIRNPSASKLLEMRGQTYVQASPGLRQAIDDAIESAIESGISGKGVDVQRIRDRALSDFRKLRAQESQLQQLLPLRYDVAADTERVLPVERLGFVYDPVQGRLAKTAASRAQALEPVIAAGDKLANWLGARARAASEIAPDAGLASETAARVGAATAPSLREWLESRKK